MEPSKLKIGVTAGGVRPGAAKEYNACAPVGENGAPMICAVRGGEPKHEVGVAGGATT